ncbi:MAG TPA: NADH-quinone oxidoreductase subunit NuoH [Fimbriimonadaceae bacterium]|nr:NADH-quinone oxidoreductase subunit NuoH [Fimbriimonadaceae bacterium]
MDWLRQVFWENEVGNALLRVLLFVLPILTLVPGLIWWERRLLSWMQDRIGPNRVGPFGLLQPIADGVKLFFKEDITPKAVDGLIYFIAPAVALFPAFALGATLPWGPNLKLTPIADVNIGVLYIMAISSLGVYGVVLAGYASNNKYSLLGGLRASAQLISYELAMGMALASIVLATGSLRLTDMVKAQEGPLWGAVPQVQNWFIFTPFGFIAALIFAICVIAETNRAPFDLPEAENELIAGYHTEYSSMKFAVFFMGEYAAMFIFSGVFATVFLGGWHAVPINWSALGMEQVAHWNGLLAPLFFLGKCALGITFFIWLRATLPRLRYDQLMSLGWKSLLPMGVFNFIVVATWILTTSLYGIGGGIATAVGAFAVIIFFTTRIAKSANANVEFLEKRTITMESGKGDPKPQEVNA